MPRLRLLRRLSLTAVLGVGLASGGFMLLDRAFPPDLSRLDRAGAEILDRNGRTLEMLPAAGGIWRLRTAADQVSPVFLDVLVRTEDRRFYDHGGVDPRAILRAVWQWARSGRVVSGGSTLTMQVARLLEPRPRTLRSKLVEAFRAVQLEERFSKRAILGIWLTLAPFGGNLEGVRAGSQAWFGKRPAALDRAEAALLVAIPRRPEGLRPDRHPDRALALRDRLLGDDAGAERDEALPTARLPFPRHAEPALRALVAASPQPDGMVTTFDLPLQVAAERLVADRLARLPPRVSIAVLVADARSRAVLAAVSGDGGPGRAGSLDLTMASRSPGSALKPLLYGIAFQDGLVTPATPVSDLPRHFGGYAPENFDRSFAGTVTAAEALRRSLNLPAVALLDRIGPTRFAAGAWRRWHPAARPAPALRSTGQ
jgi:penicillin-binding protein 1C